MVPLRIFSRALGAGTIMGCPLSLNRIFRSHLPRSATFYPALLGMQKHGYALNAGIPASVRTSVYEGVFGAQLHPKSVHSLFITSPLSLSKFEFLHLSRRGF